MERIEVVVAHNERVTLRACDLFLKIDVDKARARREVEAMALAPIPTPEVCWHEPPVLALRVLPGNPLGRLGVPSIASPAAWAAAGAVIRELHEAPVPSLPGPSQDELTADIDAACEWLSENSVLTDKVVSRNRQIAQAALRPWTAVFTHGDLQVDHVFVDGDVITGVIDWSEAGQGDPMYDLATLTIGHPERVADVIAGYGGVVDVELLRAWWSFRSLRNARWLIEHGFDPSAPGCEFDVLKSA